MIGNWASLVVNSAIYKTPFDYLNDFEPVARLSGNPYIIVGKNALPKTLPELIAWLKANPDKATEGTGGAGSGQHVGGVYFQKMTGTRFQFVPYRAGSSDVMRDVVAGHIDLQHRSGDRVAALYPPGPGARLSRSRTASGWPPRPTFRPWTRPARPASTSSPGSACGCRRARRRRRSRSSARPPWRRWPIRSCQKRLAGLGQDIPPPETQTAEALGSVLQGRDRQMVADHPGGRHQGGASQIPQSVTGSDSMRKMDLVIRNARLSDRAGRATRHRHRERAHRGDRAAASPPMRRPTMRAAASPVRA